MNLSEGSVEQCEVGCHELEDEYLDRSAHLKLSLCTVVLKLCQSQSDGGVEAVEYGNNHSIYRTCVMVSELVFEYFSQQSECVEVSDIIEILALRARTL